MPGKLYQNDFRLTRAFAEGRDGNPATNPFPVDYVEHAAYEAGKADTSCATYAGSATCTPGAGITVPAKGAGAGSTSHDADFLAPFGSYVVTSHASPADGEVLVIMASNTIKINVLDNQGTDQTATLSAFQAGDVLRVKGGTDWWDQPLTAAPTITGGVATFAGTVTLHGSTIPDSSAVELRRKPAGTN